MVRFRLALALASALPLVLVNACGEDTMFVPDAPDGASPRIVTDAGGGLDARVVTDAGNPDVHVDPPDTGSCPIGMDETVRATVKVTADDFLRLWVNGELVDDKASTWGTVDTREVTLFRHPTRKNIIAVEGRNAFNTGGFDRGLLLDLGFDAGADAGMDGGIPGIVTDPTWKIIGTLTDGGLPDGGLPDGGTTGVVAWFAPDFDDSKWHDPVNEGPHGMSPWGPVFGTSKARWLWSYDSSIAPTKPADDLVYFRKVFYLDTAGVPSDTAPSCP